MGRFPSTGAGGIPLTHGRPPAQLDEACEAVGVTEPSLFNFVLTDGITMVATRYVRVAPGSPPMQAASLCALVAGVPFFFFFCGPALTWALAGRYFSSGSRYEPTQEGSGDYHMQHADVRDTLLIVTSEPLTDDACDWSVGRAGGLAAGGRTD